MAAVIPDRRAAAVDFGSNTIGVLIAGRRADGELETLHRKSAFVRLAEGLRRSGEISTAALERALSFTGEVADCIRALGAAHVRAVATEALRRARNRRAVAAALSDRLGAPVEIISEHQEGTLTLEGVRLGYPHGPLAMIDIGGGSTEVGLDDGAGGRQIQSIPVGGVGLTEAYGEDLGALRAAIAPHLASFAPRVAVAAALTAIGGTGANLAMIDQGSPDIARADIEGYVVDRDRLAEHREKARALSIEHRCRVFGIPQARADILVAGFVLLEQVLEKLGCAAVRTSRYCLRHGVLRSILPPA